MRGFSVLVAIMNMAILYGCVVWLLIERSGLAIVGATVAFNLTMGWLLVAGITHDENGRRSWSPRPALGIIGLSVVLGVAAFLRSA